MICRVFELSMLTSDQFNGLAYCPVAVNPSSMNMFH